MRIIRKNKREAKLRFRLCGMKKSTDVNIQHVEYNA